MEGVKLGLRVGFENGQYIFAREYIVSIRLVNISYWSVLASFSYCDFAYLTENNDIVLRHFKNMRDLYFTYHGCKGWQLLTITLL